MWILTFQLIYSSIFGAICHTDTGTEYGEKAVVAYAESNHGPDGSLFLDPYFKPDIENLNNEKVLDAGCGQHHGQYMQPSMEGKFMLSIFKME